MAFFRPRVSREAEVRYHADQEVGKSFPELLEKARHGRGRRCAGLQATDLRRGAPGRGAGLRQGADRGAAGGRGRPAGDVRVKSYDDRIARRKARATPEGRRVDRRGRPPAHPARAEPPDRHRRVPRPVPVPASPRRPSRSPPGRRREFAPVRSERTDDPYAWSRLNAHDAPVTGRRRRDRGVRGGALRSGQLAQSSSGRVLLGWRSLESDSFSSWRMRSRVRPRCLPISSSVCGLAVDEPEAQGHDLGLARGEVAEHAAQLLAEQLAVDHLGRLGASRRPR